MKKTAEDYLGEPVTEAVITVRLTLTMRSVRLPKMLVVSRGWKLNVSSTNRLPQRWLTVWIKKSATVLSRFTTSVVVLSISLLSKSTKLMAKKPLKFWQPTVIPTWVVKTSIPA
ncbi:DnaK protein [Salmonella enterica subsp. enterica]|uniref:DnaK protein n=1 Tax=Salmonella enterica I TaxID=59201 RepID=A0A379X0H7_SALET|nr:DnaK protein [Salmonella enterica subsp. enterica]